MQKFFRYNNLLYIFTHIFIGFDILNKTKGDIRSFQIFMGLLLLLILNNYLRVKHFYRDGDKFFLSMFVYMVLSGILTYKFDGNVSILNFMILCELIIFTEGKRSRVFIGASILSILFLSIGRYISPREVFELEFWRENFIDIVMLVLFLAFYSLCFFTYRALRIEKRKVDNLNKEIEELTLAKERNRLAGEIHDSLGHGLIALSMNLDVAEKIIDEDTDRARELIDTSKAICRESMTNLRRAVYALKEDGHLPLIEKLEDMISNIEGSGMVDIGLRTDEKIESLSLEYKNIIYKSVKEAITNSVKHGRASQINIDIRLDDKVKIRIKDNGLGCSHLIKGNGLLGIEDRIKDKMGSVTYHNTKGEGFGMEIEI